MSMPNEVEQDQGGAPLPNGAIAGVPVDANAQVPYQGSQWNQSPQPPGQPPTQPQPTTPADLLQIPGVSALLEQARAEEKDKLYGRLEDLGTQVSNLTEAEEARRSAAEEARQQAEEAAEARRQAELTLEERVAELQQTFHQQEQEWQERFEAQQAVFTQERVLNEISEYRQAVLNQYGNEILPELVDLVRGNTQAEVDASLQDALARSQQIVANVRQAMVPGFGTVNPTGMPRGNAVTAPSIGPMDEGPGNIRSLTAQDIAAMSPDEYARHREQIMGELSRQVQARGGSPYQ